MGRQTTDAVNRQAGVLFASESPSLRKIKNPKGLGELSNKDVTHKAIVENGLRFNHLQPTGTEYALKKTISFAALNK